MADHIVFQVLDVGQGNGNFIEIFEQGALRSSILIDLGSEAYKSQAGGPSAEHIVTALSGMAQPTIDTVILSHSDKDHINLVEAVLNVFWPPGSGHNPTLTINCVRYGGAYELYQKGNKPNVIDLLRTYCGNVGPMSGQVGAVAPAASSFSAGVNSQPFRTVLGVNLYILAANVPASDQPQSYDQFKSKTDSFAINTRSVMVLVSFGGSQLLATGDATGVTLRYARRWLTGPVKQRFFTYTYMVTLPHHGSATTTFDLASYGNKDAARKNLSDFIDAVQPRSITGSAERRRNFNHPSADVISCFWNKLDPNPFWKEQRLPEERHFFTAYFNQGEFSYDNGGMDLEWPKSAYWYSIQSKANVYTNLYFVRDQQAEVQLPPSGSPEVAKLVFAPGTIPPDLGVAWSYKVAANGARELALLPNRPNQLALRRAMMAGVPPEDLPVPEHVPQGPPGEEPEQPGSEDAAPHPPPPRPEGGRASPALARRDPPPGFERLRVIP